MPWCVMSMSSSMSMATDENLYLGHERKPMNRPTQLEQVKEKLTHLPSDRLIEVNDFIDFLQQRDRDRSLRQAYTRKPSGPVTCLGMTFENDEARRAHFTEELRKKLQDPEFRKIEGFPIGSDEDILNLSDPPYYTACPNPWIADFIAEWEAQKPSSLKAITITVSLCGRCERGEKRPDLQRALLSHQGAA
jgi:hypothetical protein